MHIHISETRNLKAAIAEVEKNCTLATLKKKIKCISPKETQGKLSPQDFITYKFR